MLAIKSRILSSWRILTALLVYEVIRISNFLLFYFYMGLRHRSWLEVFYRWDSQWYKSIAQNGYGHTVLSKGRTLTNETFFPLFPFLERAITRLFGFSYIDSGILISAIFGLVAAAMIYKSVEIISSPKAALVTVLLWGLLPVGYVQMLAYSETLFTALCAFALYYSLKKNFLLASLFCILAGLTRPSGLAVALAISIGVVMQLRKSSKIQMQLKNLLALILSPLGWLGFLIYLALKHHDPLAYFALQKDWKNGFDCGSAFLQWIWHYFSARNPLAGIGVVIASSIPFFLFRASIKTKQPIEFLVFSGFLIFISFTTQGYFGSKPRYLMPAYPLLIPLSTWLVGTSRFKRGLFIVVFSAVGSIASVIALAGNGPP